MSDSPERLAFLQALGATHGFSVEELLRNRSGYFHPAQLARGQGFGLGGSIVLALLGMSAIALGLVCSSLIYGDDWRSLSDVDRNGAQAFIAGGCVLALIFLLSAGLRLRRFTRRRGRYQKGKLSVIEGPLLKSRIDGRGGVPTQWLYRLGPLQLAVSAEAWELTSHGAHYRAYHLNGELLSLEPL